ncbi:hypothetical protein, partial [Streptomyces sp. NPDC001774]
DPLNIAALTFGGLGIITGVLSGVADGVLALGKRYLGKMRPSDTAPTPARPSLNGDEPPRLLGGGKANLDDTAFENTENMRPYLQFRGAHTVEAPYAAGKSVLEAWGQVLEGARKFRARDGCAVVVFCMAVNILKGHLIYPDPASAGGIPYKWGRLLYGPPELEQVTDEVVMHHFIRGEGKAGGVYALAMSGHESLIVLDDMAMEYVFDINLKKPGEMSTIWGYVTGRVTGEQHPNSFDLHYLGQMRDNLPWS